MRYSISITYEVEADNSTQAFQKAVRYQWDSLFQRSQELKKLCGQQPEVIVTDCNIEKIIE